MNTIMRKSMLSVAGLAFAGGVFAGPIAAHANPGRRQARRGGGAGRQARHRQADPARHPGRPVPHHPERRADRQRQGDHRRHEEGRSAGAGRGHLDRDEPAGVEAGEPGSPGRHATTTTRWACSSSARARVGVPRSRSPTLSTRRPRSSRV